MRRIALLTAFSALFVGCGIPRPDAYVCVVNVPALHEYCYNLKNDYDSAGNLKPGAKPMIRQYQSPDEMLSALNKRIDTDPEGWANIKAYIKQISARAGH